MCLRKASRFSATLVWTKWLCKWHWDMLKRDFASWNALPSTMTRLTVRYSPRVQRKGLVPASIKNTRVSRVYDPLRSEWIRIDVYHWNGVVKERSKTRRGWVLSFVFIDVFAVLEIMDCKIIDCKIMEFDRFFSLWEW